MVNHTVAYAPGSFALPSPEGWPGEKSEEQLLRTLKLQVYRAARQVRPAGQDVEDLLAEGFLCARRALGSYDPERGVPFPAYYQLLLRRRFIDLGRRKRPRSNTDLEAALAPRTEEAERSEHLRCEVRDAIARLLDDKQLRDNEREVFRLFHLEGWKFAQLSLHFGKCVETVRRWLKTAEKRFKYLWLQGEHH